MWKLIVIYMNKYQIMDSNELDARIALSSCEHSPSVLYAFLYDDKQRLVETLSNPFGDIRT